MTRIYMVLVASLILTGVWAGCGDGKSKEDIAVGVAREWVESSVELVSDFAAELIIADRPDLTQLAGAVIADQVRDRLSWTYSVPKAVGEDRYSVIATATADLKIDLPLLGEKAYSVSAPFNLKVDTSARAVSDWSMGFDSAKVEEK